MTKLLDFCRRIKCPITLAYIDLDNFKNVNDTFGHTEGDRVLKVVGTSLSRACAAPILSGVWAVTNLRWPCRTPIKMQARTVIEKMHLQLMKEIGLT